MTHTALVTKVSPCTVSETMGEVVIDAPAGWCFDCGLHSLVNQAAMLANASMPNQAQLRQLAYDDYAEHRLTKCTASCHCQDETSR